MSGKTTDAAAVESPKLYALLAEFDSVNGILRACEKVRDAGFRRWDAFTPFPVHGMNDAMGLKYTRLPLLVLGAGLTGMTVGLVLQWWMNAHDYKLIVSGKPFMGLPANIPVVFELTILFSAIAAFVGMLAMNNLPMLHHPIFKSERFRKVTTDRFFIAIEADDPKFDEARTTAFLREIGGLAVERVED